MDERRVLGLQWRLVAAIVAAGLLSTGMAAAGFWVAVAYGLGQSEALAAGVAAGLAGGLAASIWGFWLARGVKRRLWNAGELALRIRQGDLSARLPVGEPDEIGELERRLNQMAEYLEQAVGELSRLAEQNRILAEEARRGAALEERARIARDLHDTVNQQLFVLSLRTAAVRRRVVAELAGRVQNGTAAGVPASGGSAQAAPREGAAATSLSPDSATPAPAAGTPPSPAGAVLTPTLAEELAALEELARAAHSQTRALILQLRPTTLEQQGLGPALAEYVKTVATREGWEVQLEIDPAIRLRGAPGEALFRVAQEALNNVAKHARARTVRVALQRSDGQVQLTVADDGVGFDRNTGIRPTAVGLAGMRERMASLGGRIQLRTAPGQGTEVQAILPEPTGTPEESGVRPL